MDQEVTTAGRLEGTRAAVRAMNAAAMWSPLQTLAPAMSRAATAALPAASMASPSPSPPPPPPPAGPSPVAMRPSAAPAAKSSSRAARISRRRVPPRRSTRAGLSLRIDYSAVFLPRRHLPIQLVGQDLADCHGVVMNPPKDALIDPTNWSRTPKQSAETDREAGGNNGVSDRKIRASW
ncbi:hypothetical protein ACP4OV_026761 [Aristida adscensionis]